MAEWSIPEVVRQKARARGDAGRVWLEALPAVVDDLAESWSLRLDGLLHGGTSALVLRVTDASGDAGVLKLPVPGEPFEAQVRALELARGRGYVELRAHDPGRRALLLELLGDSLAGDSVAPQPTLELLARTLLLAWRPAEELGDAPYDKASGLAELVERLWHELERPCPAPVVEEALRRAARRAAAFEPERCRVLHGDAAAANLLRVRRSRPGAETGFVFVDPDGFVGDPTYDLGVAVRDWCGELLASSDPVALARRFCRILADAAGVDPEAVWDWGFLERVSTGLYAWSIGGEALGGAHLRSAAALLGRR